MELPFENDSFNLVTAFETIYFCPGLANCFRKVHWVTKPGGIFFICNESNSKTSKDDKWVEKIDCMIIYNTVQILNALNEAGFSNAHVNKNEKG